MARRDVVYSAWKAWDAAEKLKNEARHLRENSHEVPLELVKKFSESELVARSAFVKALRA